MMVSVKVARFWPLLVLALVCLIPLADTLVSGKALGPFDHLAPMVGAKGAKPAQNWDVLQADGALQFYPWRSLVLQSWHEGRVPFWNSFQLGGTQLLANSQSAGLYPPHILLGLMGVGAVAAMKVLAYFHLLWAAVGAYLLARRLGAEREGALIAGAGFALSSFMVAWIGLPSVVTTCSWIPWVLLCAERALASNGFRRSLVPSVGLAASFGMMILAGHLQFVAYGGIAVALLLVWRTVGLVRQGWWCAGPSLGAGIALVVGCALAAPQLLPVLDYARFSHRSNSPTAEGYAAYVEASVKPYELPALVSLGFLGHPGSLHPEPALPNYWPGLAKTGANPAESAITLGPLLLTLLALGFATKRFDKRTRPYLTLMGFALLLWSGSPLNAAFYFGVPGWSATGSPARSAVLFVLAGSLLAGVAWPKNAEPDGQGGRLALSAGVSVLVLVLVAFGLAMSGMGATVRPFMAERGVELDTSGGQASLVPTIAMVLAAVGALWALREGKLKGREPWAAAGLALLLATTYASGWVPNGTVPAKPAVLESVRPEQRVAFVNEAWEIVIAAPATMPPNTATWFGVRDIAGYDSLLHRDTVEMLRDIGGQDPAPPANGNIMFTKPKPNLAALAEAGVSVLFSPLPLEGVPDGVQTEMGVRYVLAGAGRFQFGGTFETIEDKPGRIALDVQGPGRLVVRERNMAGWRAWVSDRQVEVGTGRWLELDVPSGDHRVRLEFEPTGYARGLSIAAVAALLCAVALVIGVRTKPGRSDERLQ